MNESKKLLYVRIIIALVIIVFIGLFLFLIIKIDVVGHLFNNKNYIRTASGSNLDRYISELDDREFVENKREKKNVEKKKKDREEKVVDKSIFKFVEAIKSKRAGSSIINRNNTTLDTLTINSKKIDTEKKKEVDKEVKRIQSFYDKGYYPKSSWMLIDEDFDGNGYNYYFNDKGKFAVDTVAPDYRIVDAYGREIDENLEPISYKVEMSSVSELGTEPIVKYGLTSDGIILAPGVERKEKSKYYDNQMNRHVLDYIDYIAIIKVDNI